MWEKIRTVHMLYKVFLKKACVFMITSARYICIYVLLSVFDINQSCKTESSNRGTVCTASISD